MKDTITIKIKIDAEFDTIQAIRENLNKNEFEKNLLMTAKKVLNQIDKNYTATLTAKISNPHVTKESSLPTPQVEDGLLSWIDPNNHKKSTIGAVGSKDFVKFLNDADIRSFSYLSSQNCTFTAIKDKRGYFYAHKLLNNNLKRKYLGKPSQRWTIKKLDNIAFDLSQRTLL